MFCWKVFLAKENFPIESEGNLFNQSSRQEFSINIQLQEFDFIKFDLFPTVGRRGREFSAPSYSIFLWNFPFFLGDH